MQFVDYHAITKNALFFKRMLGKSKLCAVVKNDAYGHGLVRTASVLRDVVDMFAVCSVREACEISCFGRDILVLLPLDEADTKIAAKNDFAVTVDSFGTLDIAQKYGVRAHIKLDSGMSRLGFCESETDRLAEKLVNSKLKADGIFSHFFGNDELSRDNQLQVFERCSKKLLNVLRQKPLLHIANTSASFDERCRLDMCRIGFGLYGYGSRELTPAKSVSCKVLAAKRIPACSSVGYGGRKVPRETNVAVIQTGYANGFSRKLVDSFVSCRQCKCKVLAVCMGMTIIDTGDFCAEVGESVDLLGTSVNPSNSDVIAYELLCNLR